MKISKEELRQALAETREEELDSILNACEDKELEQRIEASKERMNLEKIHRLAKKQKKVHWRRLPRAASVILAVVFVGATSVYAIGKVHHAMLEWDVELGEDEDDLHIEAASPTGIEASKEMKEVPDVIEAYYGPAYIPAGYFERDDNGAIRDEWAYGTYYVKNEEQFIVYSQTTLGGTTSIDSEGAKRKTVDINGWKGQMNYKEDKKTIIWATDEYVFVLTGFGEISEEEMLKVARSVAPIS